MSKELIEALSDIEREKGISKDVLIEAIEAALISSYKRNFNTAQNVRVDINRTTGQIKVFARKTIVEEVLDPRLEISLEAARSINPLYNLDDIVEIEVTPSDFGRIAAQTAKQVVTQRIREAERGLIYNAFVDKEQDIVTGIVMRADQRNLYVDLGKAEAILPLTELMPGDRLKQGDRVKTFIVKVETRPKGRRSSCRGRIRDCSSGCSSWKCRKFSTARWKSAPSPAKRVSAPRSRSIRATPRWIPSAPASAPREHACKRWSMS